MNIYIWVDVNECTGNYHSSGGVVVVAETEERARVLANLEDSNCNIHAEETPIVYKLLDTPPEVAYTFPNAGCC